MENKKFNGSFIYAIVGVMVLIVAVAGSAYAYYQASVANSTSVTGTAGGGAAPTLTVTKESTSANGNLIPINMTTTDLTSGAKGYGNTGSSFDATKSCIDKNSYSVCQVYSVTVKNNSNTDQTFNINLTSLTAGSAPNLEAVKMNTSVSVTDVTSIKNNGLICTTSSLANNATSTKCYFMVFIKNLSTAQTDSGSFTGTVTATSSTGDKIYAKFS